MKKTAFIITIDTEGDNLWSKSTQITTENAKRLPRFQRLCERFGLKPTWLTNYEMALSPEFSDLARRTIRDDAGEVGMHLHAWHSPPDYRLTDDDYRHHPYLIDYPTEVMRKKMEYMTRLLEQTFETSITSHRAGRWTLDHRYVAILEELGYLTDCSVTPGVSWRSTLGNPIGLGGTDYSAFPDQPYFMDRQDIGKSGDSHVLQVPMTIRFGAGGPLARAMYKVRGVRRLVSRAWPQPAWLRPNGHNLGAMLWLLELADEQHWPYIEFMLHSSEFMPGTATFPDESAIDKLYADMEVLFAKASGFCTGMTLSEFRTYFTDPLNSLGATR